MGLIFVNEIKFGLSLPQSLHVKLDVFQDDIGKK